MAAAPATMLRLNLSEAGVFVGLDLHSNRMKIWIEEAVKMREWKVELMKLLNLS